jgi:WD40 repeat protein
VAIGELGASQVVLTCGAEDARLWDLDGLRQRGHPLRGHVNSITGVALTQGDDRPMGVTVSDDQTARIWDLTADQPATGHVQQILAIAFTEIEGRPLAITGAADGTARLWDLRSRREIGQPMEGHTGDVLAVALGFADGRLVAVTAGSDATIRLWDPWHGHPLGAVLEGHTNAVGCLELLECHHRLIAVTGSEDGTIRLWDISARRPLGVALTGHIGEISYLAVRYAENDIQIVAATRLDHVYLWRVASDMTRTVLEAHLDLDDLDSVVTSARAVGVAFHHQQAVVLAAHDDNKVRTYDVGTRTLVSPPLSSHSSRVHSAAAGRFENGTAIAIIGYDGLRLWELETVRQIGEQLLGDMNSAASFVFAQIDGSPVSLVAFARKFQMCDLTTMQPIGEPLCGNDSDIAAVAIATTEVGPVVITGARDGTLRTHALANGNQIAPHLTSDSGMMAMDVLQAGDRKLALVVRFSEQVEIWDLTSRQRIESFRGQSERIACLASCKIEDRVVIVTGSFDGEVLAWDLATRMPIVEPMTEHSADITDVTARVVRGRPLAASASWDGTARVWDLRTGRVIGDPLEGHASGASAVAFGSFDDRDVVMTGDGDGRIRLWDIANHQPVNCDLESHPDGIVAIRLETLADRPFAVTADHNGLVRAWDLRAARCHAEVNVGSGISEIALTSQGNLCVATSMGVVALSLNLDADLTIKRPV